MKFFRIPAEYPEAAEAELNAFLRGCRLLTMERHLVESTKSPYWAIVVDYLEGPGRSPVPIKSRSKIDYREVLSAPDFRRYARLRDWRRAVAEAEAVPIYAVLTNEHMATIVRNRASTKEDLLAIEGIGTGRIEKYGDRLLDALAELQGMSDAADG